MRATLFSVIQCAHNSHVRADAAPSLRGTALQYVVSWPGFRPSPRRTFVLRPTEPRVHAMSHPNPQPRLPGQTKDTSGKWAFRAGIASIAFLVGSLSYVHIGRIYEANVREHRLSLPHLLRFVRRAVVRARSYLIDRLLCL